MTTATTPVMIEVAVNGVTTKERNPHVPSTPEEIAADAIRCIDAGASIVHIHNPAMRLSTADAAAMYAEALRIMRRERPTAVLYPTMGGGATIGERYDHHLPLAQEGLIDMGVIDPGSVNLSSSGADGAPPTGDYVYTNSPADIGYMMDVCRKHDIGPSFAIYEPGFLRMVLIYQQSGRLAPHSLTKFYFSGGARTSAEAHRHSLRRRSSKHSISTSRCSATLPCRGAWRCWAGRFSTHPSPSVRSSAAATSVSASKTTPVGRPTSIRSRGRWHCAKRSGGLSQRARRRANYWPSDSGIINSSRSFSIAARFHSSDDVGTPW